VALARRWAVLGAGLGVLVLLVLRGLGSWRRTVGAIIPLVLVCVAGYFVVPSSLQARVRSTFASDKIPVGIADSNQLPGDLAPGQYTVQLRTIYRHEGIALVKQHPFLGVGVGDYHTGDPTNQTVTTDPHNVLLLGAGEGGVPDLALFLLMLAGTGFVMLRRRRFSPWAAPALALQAAILTHGLVDVYWVRGTPVIGWLLVGMALNPLLANDSEADEANEPQAVLPQLTPAMA
jgi:O-antigen ligase